MIQTIATCTVAITLAEMGDKTQLLALTLAARFRAPKTVLAGIFIATVINHLLSAWLGAAVAGWLGPNLVRWIVGLGFLAFAAWTLVPDSEPEGAMEAQYGSPLMTTIVLFFLAEMGDKTQLATVALAAKLDSIVAVTIGTTAGMMIADGLAVVLGDRLGASFNPTLLRRVAAALFLVLGVVTLVVPIG
jgi:putative Ca2+/H+ antiporter (TMEM165/GDT1 family)